MTEHTPAVYCGTYAKYNDGSLYGAWVNLTDYQNADEFVEDCLALHKDESDPELMFQDWEHIPEQFIGESFIDVAYWDYLAAIENSLLEAEVFEAAADLGIGFDDVEELYQGQYDSDEDFAYDFAEQIGVLDDEAQWPHNCVDWVRAARDLMCDYGESGGHYFRTSY